MRTPRGLDAAAPTRTDSTSADYAFGSFRFDPERGSLQLHDAPVAVGTRALQLLEALSERGGDLVTKEEL